MSYYSNFHVQGLLFMSLHFLYSLHERVPMTWQENVLKKDGFLRATLKTPAAAEAGKLHFILSYKSAIEIQGQIFESYR